LFGSRAQDSLLVFFIEVFAWSKTNVCSDQGLKIVCWFFFQKFLFDQEPMLVRIKGSRLFAGFFLEVRVQSKTNACQNQGLKIIY
jgi:hypothetical protein